MLLHLNTFGPRFSLSSHVNNGIYIILSFLVLLLPFLGLQQSKSVADGTIPLNKLPLERGGVEDGQAAETVVRLVEDVCDVERLVGREGRVRLDVAGHAVDDVRHGLARVGLVGVVVDDRGLVDGAVGAEGPETFVPVDMASSKELVCG